MKKTFSRIIVVLLAMVMVITSALAVFAETEGGQPGNEVQNSSASAGALNEGEVEDPPADVKQYVITFDPGKESIEGSMESVTITDKEEDGEGEDYVLPACDFTAPEGFEFDCWQIGDKTYAPEDPVRITEDTTVTALWKELFTVTFTDGYSGKVLATETVVSGSAATAPANPSRSGYTFDGWDKDFSAVTADLTVNAKWKAIPHTHSYGGWTTTVSPTYFRNGTRVRKCSCGATETQTIARLTAKNKWVSDGGKLYYFGSNGSPVKGWVKMKPYKSKKVRWCYFTQAGAYVKNISKSTRNKWVNAGGYKFYFTKKRKPAGYGFNVVKNKLYHMNRFGAVMYGTFKASDGNTYTTAKNGSISGLAYYKYKYKTFVLVDISDQTIWFYKNGKQKLKSDVVTGTKGRTPTPTGTFKVRKKLRNINLVGPSWNSHVSYWIAFKGSSYGLHDASWRTSKQFSNHRTYLNNGSHGCINLRYSTAASLYSMVKRGTPVIVQR